MGSQLKKAAKSWNKEELLELYKKDMGYYPIKDSIFGPGVLKKMKTYISEEDPEDGFEDANVEFIGEESFEVRDAGRKGKGVFSTTLIRKNSNVGEYIGVISISKPPHESNYILQTAADLFIDSKEFGNFSRFCNHGCTPNIRISSVNDKGRIRTLLIARRDIYAGEELTYKYRFTVARNRDVYPCLCMDSCTNVFGIKEKSKPTPNTKTSDKDKKTNRRRFACGQCPKSFEYRSLLLRHQAIHNPAKTFQCTYCPNKFRQDTALKRHLTTIHGTPKVYSCPSCPGNTQFKRKDHYKRHMLEVHKKVV